MGKRAKESYTIQSVMHGLDLLEQFHGDEAEIGVTDLARRLGLHKNNVFRLLATLETRGYVVQNLETEGYRLGVKALELGRSYLRHASIVSVGAPTLADLRDKTSETAYLAVLQNEEAVYVLAEESPRSVRAASRIGQHVPALHSAAGRAQLAHLRVLPYRAHPLRRLTDPRPGDLRKLEHDLDRIRESGHCLDVGGFDPDLTCIAAPVFNDQGDVAGAVEVQVPSFRATSERVISDIIGATMAAAIEVSRALGHQPGTRASITPLAASGS